MNYNPLSRRKFLKKNALAGVVCATGIPFLLGNSRSPELDNSFRPLRLGENYEEIDWEAVRAAFLIDANKNYFNTASLGPSPKIVVDKVCDAMRELETSCSHGHHLAAQTHAVIASFLNVTEDEIAVIRNATEGMNIIARMLRLKKGDEVLITTHEHVGGAAPWLALKNDLGIRIRLIDIDQSGEKNLQLIQDHISAKTKAIVFSHITCTTGMRLPAKEIAALCRANNIYSCVDGAQALGMFPIDLHDMNPDFYTSSGHKWLLGPKGTGVLYINKERLKELAPVYAGAYTDSEYNLETQTLKYRLSAQREEYGTRNTPMVLGLSQAIDFMNDIGMENVARRGRELSLRFRSGVKELTNIDILTPENEQYSASILTFRIKGIDNLELNQKISRDHKVRLRGIYENDLNAIRISFSIFNTDQEVDYLIETIRALSKANE
jgi:selenocysteine lyase/cysteine desulfurase